MRLNWYTCLAEDGQSNTGTSVLWTVHGVYQWINHREGFTSMIPPMIEIVFFPRSGKSRVLERIGKFKGEDRIEHAEAAVERDIEEKRISNF